MACEAVKEPEIGWIEGVNIGDASLMPDGGNEGIQDSFPTEVMLLHPVEPLLAGGYFLMQEGDFGGLCPKVGDVDGFRHGQGL